VNVTVTKLFLVVATCRLEMSAGRHAALAGTLIGPERQESQAPAIWVPPARDRTISRHSWSSGRPHAIIRILVPQVVAVRVTVTRTCVAGLAPDSVMVADGLAAGWPAPGWASQ
jgi:hypothetical protein